MLAFELQQEKKEIPLRHNTSARLFIKRGYVWPVKTLDPDYLVPIQFRICLCLSSVLLVALVPGLVLVSLVKTRLYTP